MRPLESFTTHLPAAGSPSLLLTNSSSTDLSNIYCHGSQEGRQMTQSPCIEPDIESEPITNGRAVEGVLSSTILQMTKLNLL